MFVRQAVHLAAYAAAGSKSLWRELFQDLQNHLIGQAEEAGATLVDLV
jgi:hypothetical protein